jgi:hypothetical protein
MTVLLAGCMFHKSAQAPNPAPTAPLANQAPKPVIKPNLRSTGQVAMVNEAAKFAVINFPDGPVPQMDRHLNVYRNGQKVGELKVTGPQRDNDTVADIISGDVQLRDEVRAE